MISCLAGIIGLFPSLHQMGKLFIFHYLADSEDDRIRRTEFMKRVNDAYMGGDHQALKELLEEWKSMPAHVAGDGIGEELIRVIRKIDLVSNTIEKLEKENISLMESEYFKLMKDYDTALENGQDILVEMEEFFNEQIRNKQREYDDLLKDFGQ